MIFQGVIKNPPCPPLQKGGDLSLKLMTLPRRGEGKGKSLSGADKSSSVFSQKGLNPVIPAKRESRSTCYHKDWIPAFAGMTGDTYTCRRTRSGEGNNWGHVRFEVISSQLPFFKPITDSCI